LRQSNVASTAVHQRFAFSQPTPLGEQFEHRPAQEHRHPQRPRLPIRLTCWAKPIWPRKAMKLASQPNGGMAFGLSSRLSLVEPKSAVISVRVVL
jgi:hypothetical protein